MDNRVSSWVLELCSGNQTKWIIVSLHGFWSYVAAIRLNGESCLFMGSGIMQR
jgi:hypothetical protein